MAATQIPFGNPKAQKKWSASLAHDTTKESYFETRFIGTDENNIIQRKTELESDSGDTISFDLSVKLRNKPTYGDARVEGKEEALKFFTDEVKIDQVRHSVSAGGRMSRKRTSHDMRSIAKQKLTGYFAQLLDELLFIYLSGARGINEDFIEDTSYTGFANNALNAPDADHILYGGSATSKGTITNTDKMSKALIERANNKAAMMQARNPETANMVPVKNGSAENYVLLMSKDQEYDLRNADTAGWIEIQKALIQAKGEKTPIFEGGLGMIGGTVLHSHRNVIRFSDYGSGQNLPAARALFMGRQAAVIAYGTTGGMRFSWEETVKDYKNEPSVAAGFIGGIKKARFNNKDFGVMSLDTSAKDPNAAA